MFHFLWFNSSSLTRIIYSSLFNSFADFNSLFSYLPTSQPVIVVNNQSQVCTQATCIPALFYDFYTNENVTLLNQARLVSTRLKSKRTLTVSTTANQLNQEIEQAWIAYNLQATIPAFQNSLNAKIYSIIHETFK